MSSLSVANLYYSLRLHFNDERYDAIKYQFKIKNKFIPNNYIYIFDKLDKKYKKEILYFYVSNFIINPSIWINDLLLEESDDNYKKWLRKYESLTYHFKSDILDIMNDYDNLNEVLVIKDTYPILLTRVFQGKTSIETLLMLNSCLKFLGNWDKKLKDDITWSPFFFKCKRYYRFLRFNKEGVMIYLKEINK